MLCRMVGNLWRQRQDASEARWSKIYSDCRNQIVIDKYWDAVHQIVFCRAIAWSNGVWRAEVLTCVSPSDPNLTSNPIPGGPGGAGLRHRVVLANLETWFHQLPCIEGLLNVIYEVLLPKTSYVLLLKSVNNFQHCNWYYSRYFATQRNICWCNI